MNYRSIVIGEIIVIAISYWAQNGQLGLFVKASTGAEKLSATGAQR